VLIQFTGEGERSDADVYIEPCANRIRLPLSDGASRSASAIWMLPRSDAASRLAGYRLMPGNPSGLLPCSSLVATRSISRSAFRSEFATTSPETDRSVALLPWP
jgi:hypothetical protein